LTSAFSGIKTEYHKSRNGVPISDYLLLKGLCRI